MAKPAVVAVGLIALSACGRVGFEPMAQQNDDDGVTVADATSVIPDAACLRGPFGPPLRLAEVSSNATESGGWISDDGLEVIFGSSRSGDVDLYQARRATISDPFGAPTLALLNGSSPEAEDNPVLSIDSLTMWFDRNRVMRKAIRPDLDSPFELDTDGALTPSDSEFAIGLSRDELRLAYTTDRDAPNILKLSVATRDSIADPFPIGIEQTNLGAGSFTCCATFSPDGQSVIHTSSAPYPFHLAIAQYNGSEYVNSIALDTMAAFDGYDEYDPYWSRNGKFLIFSSDRNDTTAGEDLYLMTAECL